MTSRFKTIEAIRRDNPALAEDIDQAQTCCEPYGCDAEGRMLYSERLILTAVHVMAGGMPNDDSAPSGDE